MCICAHRRFTDLSPTTRPARVFAVATVAEALPQADRTLIDDCELVIGELVANAVKASADVADAKHIDVAVTLHRDYVEIAVTDDARGWPVLQPPSPSAAGGRGLRLVAALSSRWGVTIAEDKRTTVWAQLSCDPVATTGVSCSD